MRTLVDTGKKGCVPLSLGSDDAELEDVALPDGVEGFSSRRVGLVAKVTREWMSALVDLGGRNNLIHYRDLKLGTADLTLADSRSLAALLQGKSVRVSTLISFEEEKDREREIRRFRTIHNKAKENFEERGLETLSIGCGLAMWTNQRGTWEPCAPVLLRQGTIHALGAAQDDYELTLVDEMEVNPTLLHVLNQDFEVSMSAEKLLDRVDGAIDEPWELEAAYEWLAEHAERVPGFRIEPRIVLANFAYAKLPMVNDLEKSFEELVAHDLIAAIAGDEEAREQIRAQAVDTEPSLHPDEIALADEFLVLDADASQNYAINAVLGGQNLIVRGPPGTGKSQTIANLIASSVARGKKVLFVAEKRAAIDAVAKRLKQTGLGDLVLDVHGGVSSRRAFAEAMGAAIDASRTATRSDNVAELDRTERRRDELNAYSEALHERRQPWGVSVYQARAELTGLRDVNCAIRFDRSQLALLGGDACRQAEDNLREFARFGGFSIELSGRPWALADIVSTEEARLAYESVTELQNRVLPNATKLLAQAAEQCGVAPPTTLDGWSDLLDLWGEIADVANSFTEVVYSLNLDDTCRDLAPAAQGSLSRAMAKMTSGSYRLARRALRSCSIGEPPGDVVLLQCANQARACARRWSAQSADVPPRAPTALKGLRALHDRSRAAMQSVETITGLPLLSVSAATALETLKGLLDDRTTLMTLPEISGLEVSLNAVGLSEFGSAMKAIEASEATAVRSFRYSWLMSILDEVDFSDPIISAFNANKHERAVVDYREGDLAHIESTPMRIKRLCAERSVAARDAFRDQSEIVESQARRKRGHLPVRDLVQNAPDILLSLKPCWATSPLVVSQLLPARQYFDVVVFDEASQIRPADAVSAIVRGKQLVVAGDEKQLPPTSFFLGGDLDGDGQSPDELEGEVEDVPLFAGTSGMESILNALGSLFPFRMLQWHYRSRDERLIAFSNAHLYDRLLTTFPGAGVGSPVLRRVEVPPDSSGETNSPSAEVNAVVDLIIEHATARPEESLGVIAMGVKHSNRIEETLRQRLSADHQLAESLSDFFDEALDERFFIKNLERVQGDERDAIILSIGYGKDTKGNLPYRFGPLLSEGGERRLNVAVTRAKNRITLVSSFSFRDMDPEKSTAEGVKLLRQYLQYVDSDGTSLGDRIIEKPALNPFEIDVRDTLSREGLKLVPQYGCSNYWIDFAIQDPSRPGEFVLAVECDGATYHSSESARDRDRLRQEQLERLGWHFHRIWSTEWFHDKESAVAKVLRAYETAVTTSRTAPVRPPPYIAASVANSSSARARVRPRIRPGLSIDQYTDAEVGAIVDWIESDDLLRTEEELIRETMQELGFQRRGRNVVARLSDAIRKHRRMRQE